MDGEPKKKSKSQPFVFELPCVLGVHDKPLTNLQSCIECPFGLAFSNDGRFGKVESKGHCPLWKAIKDTNVDLFHRLGCPKTDRYQGLYECWSECNKTQRSSCSVTITISEKEIARQDKLIEIEEKLVNLPALLETEIQEVKGKFKDDIANYIKIKSKRASDVEKLNKPTASKGSVKGPKHKSDVPESNSKREKRQTPVNGTNREANKEAASKPRRGRPPSANKASAPRIKGKPAEPTTKKRRGRPPKQSS